MAKNKIINILYVLDLLTIWYTTNTQNFCILYALTTAIFTIIRSFFFEKSFINNLLDCIIFQLPIVLITLWEENKIVENKVKIIVFVIILMNVFFILVIYLLRNK